MTPNKVKFGTKQFNNPTPSRINLWVRVFTVAAGVFMGWMATASLMGPNTKDIINSILGLLKHPLTDIGLAKFIEDSKKM